MQTGHGDQELFANRVHCRTVIGNRDREKFREHLPLEQRRGDALERVAVAANVMAEGPFTAASDTRSEALSSSGAIFRYGAPTASMRPAFAGLPCSRLRWKDRCIAASRS